ncbi:hypothetical protein BASA62_001136 [Batrachochytrium salamandrivorans]|nr:hypothetical protein BASA62_001136 [Batrachochytrium salamandrivorans]
MSPPFTYAGASNPKRQLRFLGWILLMTALWAFWATPELPAILPGQVSPLKPSVSIHQIRSLAVGISSALSWPIHTWTDVSLLTRALGPALPGRGPSRIWTRPPPPEVPISTWPISTWTYLSHRPPGLGPAPPATVPNSCIGSLHHTDTPPHDAHSTISARLLHHMLE